MGEGSGRPPERGTCEAVASDGHWGGGAAPARGSRGEARCSGGRRRGEAARATAGAAGAREAQRQQRLQGQMRALGVASAGATGRARANVRVATVTAH